MNVCVREREKKINEEWERKSYDMKRYTLKRTRNYYTKLLYKIITQNYYTKLSPIKLYYHTKVSNL